MERNCIYTSDLFDVYEVTADKGSLIKNRIYDVESKGLAKLYGIFVRFDIYGRPIVLLDFMPNNRSLILYDDIDEESNISDFIKALKAAKTVCDQLDMIL